MRIKKINEQQYHSLLMNEEMHYPKFLDKLKEDVLIRVCAEIQSKIKEKIYKFEFLCPYKCQYIDEILFDVNINRYGDIKNKKEYQCFYYNPFNTLINNKLLQPRITINCPCQNNIFLVAILRVALSHELTHLYDDWSEMSREKDGVNYKQKNIDTTSFINDSFLIEDNQLFQKLSMLSYMSLKVERQAFLSQTVQELEEVGCTLYNYKEKLKETILYNNITKSFNGLFDIIDNSDEQVLFDCNKKIIATYPKANLPKLNMGDFNCEKYRNMLKNWADKIFHNTMKNYASVVQYYLDKLQEEKNNMTSMYIL